MSDTCYGLSVMPENVKDDWTLPVIVNRQLIALAPKTVLFVVSLSKGYGTQLIDSSLL